MTSKNDSSSPDHSEYDPLEAFQSLTPAGCKSPTEMRHVQAGFFQKATDQYHEESGKLVELSARMMARLQSETQCDV